MGQASEASGSSYGVSLEERFPLAQSVLHHIQAAYAIARTEPNGDLLFAHAKRTYAKPPYTEALIRIG